MHDVAHYAILSMLNFIWRAGGEMADALALGASGVTHGGSSPLPRTGLQEKTRLFSKSSHLVIDESFFVC